MNYLIDNIIFNFVNNYHKVQKGTCYISQKINHQHTEPDYILIVDSLHLTA